MRSIIIFVLLLSQFCQAQITVNRESILNEVRARARAHVESGAGKDSKIVVDLYENNSIGVTKIDILDTYDREYTRAKEEHEKRDWIPKAGWVVAFLLFVAVIFLEKLKAAISKTLDFLGEKLFIFFAGIPWFYRLALNRYYKQIIERNSRLKITFRPERPLDLGAVFVPLKVSDSLDSSETFDAYTFLTKASKLVVTGSPGAGKSILMRHVALTSARNRHSTWSIGAVPILVELNRLTGPESTLLNELARELSTKGFPKPNRFLERGLKQGSLLLLLDGLDEISAVQRPFVIRQIRDLSAEFPSVPLIVSCRTQVYEGELNDVVDKTLEIQDFTDQQIRRFLRSWADDMKNQNSKSVDQLMYALKERPTIMALARNPLMLTIIAWLYTDTDVTMPHSRSEFYREATELLLYKWKPENNEYKLVPKQLVLRDLALYFQDSADQSNKDRRSMDIQAVLQRISNVLPALNIPAERATSLLDEIVQRSGLLLAIDNGERFQFAHLTLQEYFAAVALRSDRKGLIERFKQDPNAWREPVKLWCGLDEDASILIDQIYKIDQITGFECLADAQKVNGTVSRAIIEEMKVKLLNNTDDTAVIKAFGSVASSLSERGKHVFSWLCNQSTTSSYDALSYTNMPQTAEELSRYYNTLPCIKIFLIRLQELAVPHLQRLALAGDISAVNDLLSIGSPGAAVALVSLLWHDLREIKVNAALAIAELLVLPEVSTALRELNLNHPREYRWVWEPYKEDADTCLPLIAGRMVHLIESINDFDHLPKRKLDPRIIVPLCANAGGELSLLGSSGLAGSLSLEDMYVLKKRRQSSLETGKIVAETQERMVFELFNDLQPNASWKFFFDCLRLPIQAEFVRGVISSRLPTREDWINVFNPIASRDRHNWRLWLLLAFLEMVSIVNICFSFMCIRPILGLPVLFAIVLGVGGVMLGFIVNDRGNNSRCEIVSYILAGPLILVLKRYKRLNWSGLKLTKDKLKPSELGETMTVYGLILVLFICSPIWLISSFMTIHFRFTAIFTAVGLIITLSVCLAMWKLANQVERLSTNPLSGLRRFLLHGSAS